MLFSAQNEGYKQVIGCMKKYLEYRKGFRRMVGDERWGQGSGNLVSLKFCQKMCMITLFHYLFEKRAHLYKKTYGRLCGWRGIFRLPWLPVSVFLLLLDVF